ncbi:hypothetical protein L6248_01805 [Candidatus Parcubacteria bacterium]|nr:hypothetical protein [Candidatus Parcubacteria bacterium]
MQTQLQKAIDLVKKTGDRIIVFDSARSENVYVIMNIKDYENLILGKSEVRGLTEDELLDKINRDIAIWKSDQEFNDNRAVDSGKLQNKFNLDNFYDKFGGSETAYSESENSKQVSNKSKAWSIPKVIKEAAEEIIDEDRQYLENTEF